MESKHYSRSPSNSPAKAVKLLSLKEKKEPVYVPDDDDVMFVSQSNGGDKTKEVHTVDKTKAMHYGKTRSESPGSVMEESIIQDSQPEAKEHEPNQFILEELDKLLKQNQTLGERFRARAYEKAIKAIKGYRKTIKSGKEAKKIEGVGGRTAEKIQELIDTGRIQKADEEPEGVLFNGSYQVSSAFPEYPWRWA
jgi:Helix-hairpin-helix domain